MAQFQDWRVKEQLSRIVRAYQRAGRVVEPCDYSFEIDFGSLVAGASSPQPIIIKVPAEAEWVWLGNSAFPFFEQGANAGGAAQNNYFVRCRRRKTAGTLGFNIRIAGDADREWFPIYNIAGSGRLPFYWPFPMFLEPGEELIWEATNLRNNANVIRLTLLGAQLYPRAA